MTTSNLTLSSEKNQVRTSTTINTPSAYKHKHTTPGLKAFIAFLILLFLCIITHIVKFPGSVSYLKEITHGQKTLDLQASFSTAETYQRLEAFGEVGRRLYMRTMLTVDLIFPLSMFIFLFLFSKYTLQKVAMKPVLGESLQALVIGYLTFDFLENVSIFIILNNFPDRLGFLGSYIGYLTVTKRISMMGALFIPVVLLTGRKLRILFQKVWVSKRQIS